MKMVYTCFETWWLTNGWHVFFPKINIWATNPYIYNYMYIIYYWICPNNTCPYHVYVDIYIYMYSLVIKHWFWLVYSRENQRTKQLNGWFSSLKLMTPEGLPQLHVYVYVHSLFSIYIYIYIIIFGHTWNIPDQIWLIKHSLTAMHTFGFFPFFRLEPLEAALAASCKGSWTAGIS